MDAAAQPDRVIEPSQSARTPANAALACATWPTGAFLVQHARFVYQAA